MERFYLITNRAKDPDLTVTDQIRHCLLYTSDAADDSRV